MYGFLFIDKVEFSIKIMRVENDFFNLCSSTRLTCAQRILLPAYALVRCALHERISSFPKFPGMSDIFSTSLVVNVHKIATLTLSNWTQAGLLRVDVRCLRLVYLQPENYESKRSLWVLVWSLSDNHLKVLRGWSPWPTSALQNLAPVNTINVVSSRGSWN